LDGRKCVFTDSASDNAKEEKSQAFTERANREGTFGAQPFVERVVTLFLRERGPVAKIVNAARFAKVKSTKVSADGGSTNWSTAIVTRGPAEKAIFGVVIGSNYTVCEFACAVIVLLKPVVACINNLKGPVTLLNLLL
jgi:hypothetical protein